MCRFFHEARSGGGLRPALPCPGGWLPRMGPTARSSAAQASDHGHRELGFQWPAGRDLPAGASTAEIVFAGVASPLDDGSVQPSTLGPPGFRVPQHRPDETNYTLRFLATPHKRASMGGKPLACTPGNDTVAYTPQQSVNRLRVGVSPWPEGPHRSRAPGSDRMGAESGPAVHRVTWRPGLRRDRAVYEWPARDTLIRRLCDLVRRVTP